MRFSTSACRLSQLGESQFEYFVWFHPLIMNTIRYIRRTFGGSESKGDGYRLLKQGRLEEVTFDLKESGGGKALCVWSKVFTMSATLHLMNAMLLTYYFSVQITEPHQDEILFCIRLKFDSIGMFVGGIEQRASCCSHKLIARLVFSYFKLNTGNGDSQRISSNNNKSIFRFLRAFERKKSNMKKTSTYLACDDIRIEWFSLNVWFHFIDFQP